MDPEIRFLISSYILFLFDNCSLFSLLGKFGGCLHNVDDGHN